MDGMIVLIVVSIVIFAVTARFAKANSATRRGNRSTCSCGCVGWCNCGASSMHASHAFGAGRAMSNDRDGDGIPDDIDPDHGMGRAMSNDRDGDGIPDDVDPDHGAGGDTSSDSFSSSSSDSSSWDSGDSSSSDSGDSSSSSSD